MTSIQDTLYDFNTREYDWIKKPYMYTDLYTIKIFEKLRSLNNSTLKEETFAGRKFRGSARGNKLSRN